MLGILTTDRKYFVASSNYISGATKILDKFLIVFLLVNLFLGSRRVKLNNFLREELSRKETIKSTNRRKRKFKKNKRNKLDKLFLNKNSTEIDAMYKTSDNSKGNNKQLRKEKKEILKKVKKVKNSEKNLIRSKPESLCDQDQSSRSSSNEEEFEFVEPMVFDLVKNFIKLIKIS